MPLCLVPVLAKPAIYHCDDAACSGPTLTIHHVDDVDDGAVASLDHDAILDVIGSVVYFVRSEALMKLFYATCIEQCAQ
jgi:hypothetical protein